MPRFTEVLEVEFKFVPEEPESAVVAQLAREFGPEFGFAKWSPTAVLDIYLDAPDLRLYRANSSLRLRRRATPCKLDRGASSNFKYPPAAGNSIRRRELKTRLSDDEAEQVFRGAIIGESCQHASALVNGDTASPAGFSPQVIVEVYQSIYMLRRRRSPDGHSLERKLASDLLTLSFDRCTMYEVPTEGVSRFLQRGVFDIRPDQYFTELYEAEIELETRNENADLADKLYSHAFDVIKESGVHMPRRSKYAAAIESIKLVGG